MGKIGVHEFYALDGVFDNPTWTADFGFDPKMGETIGSVTGSSTAILLGRTTFEMFAPAWSTRTVEDDPGRRFFNDTPKYVVSSTLQDAGVDLAQLHRPRPVQRGRDPRPEGEGAPAISTSAAAARLVRALLADGLGR